MIHGFVESAGRRNKDLVAGGPSTKGSSSPSSWHICRSVVVLKQNQRCVMQLLVTVVMVMTTDWATSNRSEGSNKLRLWGRDVFQMPIMLLAFKAFTSSCRTDESPKGACKPAFKIAISGLGRGRDDDDHLTPRGKIPGSEAVIADDDNNLLSLLFDKPDGRPT
jgi:hypothetical protein